MIDSLVRTHRFFRGHPIGGQQLSSCWLCWLRWQLGTRLLPFPVEVPWIGDSCMVMERGMTGATGNFYCGLHEFADMALLLHWFGGGGGAGGLLDIGANVGSYTVLASAACGVESLALEPVPHTFERLRRNLRANRIDTRVDARCVAAGASRGVISFTADEDTTNRVASEDYRGRVIEVPVTPLDELLRDRESVPDFWKIDVEGFEEEVLKGAVLSLARPEVRVVLLEADATAISRTMEFNGFRRAIYEPFERRLNPGLEGAGSTNHLWVRDPAEVEARCRASAAFMVAGIEV